MEYMELSQRRSEMAGTDMGSGVWSGGHADVIGWGHNRVEHT